MPSLLSRFSTGYPSGESLIASFRRVVLGGGGAESFVGSSVEGRPLLRFDLGTRGRPVVLLTALMHGIEVIGSLALLDLLRRITDPHHPTMQRLRAEAHLVVLPIVNPDAFFINMEKALRGDRAWQRCNANGVDLNRNFPKLTTKRLHHPFSGSRFKFSPHYLGPHSLSEPESRAIFRIATDMRPALSLAFHSFGNLLLYPWAYTEQENDRATEYRSLGAVMTEALPRAPYNVRQARQLYGVLGDMDDWLDAEHRTLAFTVEVGRPDVRLRDGLELINPFRWMNPRSVRETCDNLTPGVVALLCAALGIRREAALPLRPSRLPAAIEFAAK